MAGGPLGTRARAVLLVMLGLVVGAGLAAGVVLLTGGDQGTGGPGASPSASPSPSDAPDPPPTPEERQQITQALNSADEDLLAALLSKAIRDAPREGGPPIPAGTSVDVRWDTFQLAPPDTATVTTTLSGSTSGTYTMVLVREDDTWRILAAAAQP